MIFKKIAHYIKRWNYKRTHRMLDSMEGGTAACGQDLYVADILKDVENGFFLDIGANDGVSISNTHYFEKVLGWRGVAVEPIPKTYELFKKNRSCDAVNACVAVKNGVVRFLQLSGNVEMLSTMESNYSGLTRRRIEKNMKRHGAVSTIVEVPAMTFDEIMRPYEGVEIDFMSLDIEGGELDILKSIDFAKHPIHVISVENNYFDPKFGDYMSANGYIHAGTFKVDEIYVSKNYLSRIGDTPRVH